MSFLSRFRKVAPASSLTVEPTEDPTYEYDSPMEAEEPMEPEIDLSDDSSYSRKEKNNWLAETEAIQTPIVLEALWMELFVQKGGKINRVADIAYSSKFPLKPYTRIPQGFGADSMKLMILPDVIGQNMDGHTSRQGWEFGHTNVRSLWADPNSKSGLRAETNETFVMSTLEIERLRSKMTVEEMLSQVRAFFKSVNLSADLGNAALSLNDDSPKLSIVKV